MKKTIITLALLSITVVGMAQTKKDTVKHYQKFVKLEPNDLNQLMIIANDYRRLVVYDSSQNSDAKINIQVQLDKWLKELQSKLKVDSAVVVGKP